MMRAETVGRGGALCALLLLVLSAPALATTANDICAPSADPCVVATPIPLTNLSVIDVGTRELRIDAGGALDVGSGTMTIKAGRLTVNSSGFVRADGTTATTGGTINIQVDGAVTVAGVIEANGAPAGTINLTSNGDVVISGANGLSARALLRSEAGGTINITAATATLTGSLTVLGGPDALGGDTAITTTGAVVISGTMDSTGGDGGSIDIEAGVMPGAADIVITDTAVLKVDATIPGGFGGTLDLLAHGDGVNNGRIAVDGLVSAIGRTGDSDTGGGSGGCITITADGDVASTETGAEITVAGGGPDGDGGEIEINANRGSIELDGTVDSGSAGIEGSGGSTSIDAFGDATINGLITSVGGDGGGDVDIDSDSANVHVSKTGSVDVDGTAAGSGGSITLDGGTGTTAPRSVVVEGNLSAGGAAGGGGTIELDGDDAVRVSSTAALRANANTGTGGSGGTIIVDVQSGPALIDAPVVAAGAGPSGAGGVVSIDASQRIVLTGATDARGFGAGGEIGLASTGGIDVRGNLLASSSGAGGGKIEIVSQGEVMIAASLIADGVAMPGARIDVTGCIVTICGLNSDACPSGGTGILSSLGPDGRNTTTGRDSTVVLGTMRANNNTGHNILLYNGDPDREPFILGTVTPAAEVTISGDVLPCPACGNHVIEPPETCDDGNMLDGDGCSRTCQVEAPILGDANGDFDVTPADRDFAVAEIFDGDGDTVGTVSGGTFPGSLGADANGDGFVTAADLVAITRILSP